MARAIVNIDDLRALAQRRLPRVLFDWIEGGAGDELALKRNLDVFRTIRFFPRYLLDVSTRIQSRQLFDVTYSSPFGIAPTGYAGLFRPDADLFLCSAASKANIPYIMSGSSNSSMEDAVRIAPQHTWYQLYGATETRITEDMIRRAADLGMEALVITVDIPVAAKRERDIHNGFSFPLKITLRMLADALAHPRWSLTYLRSGGVPKMQNWAHYAPSGSRAVAIANYANSHSYCVQTWKHLDDFRRLWPRKLIVKGIMHPDDAKQAVASGADGLIVSNHGGRQFDRAPTALDALPLIRAVTPKYVPVMVDGGIRRGADILAALCLGADFTFAGRAILYGAVARGTSGASAAISILRSELDQLMAQIGCLDLAYAGPQWLFKANYTSES